MKKRAVLFLLIVLCLVTTGCWNYREINMLSIVAGVGVDRDAATGDYVLYIEIIESSAASKGQSAPEGKIVETRGKTVFDAVRNTIQVSGKRLFWSHAQCIIVGEGLARQGLLDVLDWFYRDAEIRLTTHLLVAKDASVKDIMTSEGIVNEILSYEINDKIDNSDNVEKYSRVQLYKVVKMLESEVPYAFAPCITMKPQVEMKSADIFGTAIFKGDILVGYLDAEDTKYFLYVIDKVKDGLLVNYNYQNDPIADITLEVFDNKTTVKPVFSDGILAVDISTETEAAIGESGPDVNYSDSMSMTALTEDMQLFLKENIIRVVQKVQNEFATDIFGFGQLVYAEMPDVWKQYKDDGDNSFKDLQFSVTCKIKIRNSAQAGKSLKDQQ